MDHSVDEKELQVPVSEVKRDCVPLHQWKSFGYLSLLLNKNLLVKEK